MCVNLVRAILDFFKYLSDLLSGSTTNAFPGAVDARTTCFDLYSGSVVEQLLQQLKPKNLEVALG